MADAFIVRRGGGDGASSNLFAAIGVTYPEGSTCTCTNGVDTFDAKNTSGQWAFGIPEPKTLPETWAVTVTDSADATKTKSAEFEITREGQWESVVITYSEYLIKDGKSVVDHSSSNSNPGTTTSSDGTDYFTIGFNSSSWNGTGYYYYAIDVTNYNTLVLDGFSDYYNQGYGLAKFGVGKTSGTAYTGSADIPRTRDEYTLDVSNYTGTVYVIVSASGYQTSTDGWYSTRAMVANMWLE
jgi:hypothetical protein